MVRRCVVSQFKSSKQEVKTSWIDMKDLRYVLILTLALGLACSFSLLAVHGEMCSAVTKASAGDDLGSLRQRAFTAFQAQCRGKPGDLGSTTSCSFALEPSDPPGITFILQPLYEPFRLDFHVKTRRDAILVLAEEKTEESSFAWITIGSFDMHRSAVRACFLLDSPTCHELLGGRSVYDHEELLVSAEESRPFWVAYKDSELL
ncbi:uncharacterized protein LOC110979714 [Acanthaster planci]|uniref:Uncharacterized protein LOC110979714 n=1 Tax=Acanthaster planci TaxID=133434 RepID=A0A8B7YIK1_ACAPL|nr:uncharacterized protein LOC110979714 [Acanthaster planci]